MNSTERAQDPGWTPLFAAWLIAFASTLGSLFFSEIMRFAPCVLCWYQRICMYPLVLILAVALFRFDRNVVRYALPLSVLGVLLALFHLLLIAGVVPESIKPCIQGIPCTEVQIQWFGFVNIPLLSGLAFLAITALLITIATRKS